MRKLVAYLVIATVGWNSCWALPAASFQSTSALALESETIAAQALPAHPLFVHPGFWPAVFVGSILSITALAFPSLLAAEKKHQAPVTATSISQNASNLSKLMISLRTGSRAVFSTYTGKLGLERHSKVADELSHVLILAAVSDSHLPADQAPTGLTNLQHMLSNADQERKTLETNIDAYRSQRHKPGESTASIDQAASVAKDEKALSDELTSASATHEIFLPEDPGVLVRAAYSGSGQAVVDVIEVKADSYNSSGHGTAVINMVTDRYNVNLLKPGEVLPIRHQSQSVWNYGPAPSEQVDKQLDRAMAGMNVRAELKRAESGTPPVAVAQPAPTKEAAKSISASATDIAKEAKALENHMFGVLAGLPMNRHYYDDAQARQNFSNYVAEAMQAYSTPEDRILFFKTANEALEDQAALKKRYADYYQRYHSTVTNNDDLVMKVAQGEISARLQGFADANAARAATPAAVITTPVASVKPAPASPTPPPVKPVPVKADPETLQAIKDVNKQIEGINRWFNQFKTKGLSIAPLSAQVETDLNSVTDKLIAHAGNGPEKAARDQAVQNAQIAKNQITAVKALYALRDAGTPVDNAPTVQSEADAIAKGAPNPWIDPALSADTRRDLYLAAVGMAAIHNRPLALVLSNRFRVQNAYALGIQPLIQAVDQAVALDLGANGNTLKSQAVEFKNHAEDLAAQTIDVPRVGTEMSGYTLVENKLGTEIAVVSLPDSLSGIPKTALAVHSFRLTDRTPGDSRPIASWKVFVVDFKGDQLKVDGTGEAVTGEPNQDLHRLAVTLSVRLPKKPLVPLVQEEAPTPPKTDLKSRRSA